MLFGVSGLLLLLLLKEHEHFSNLSYVFVCLFVYRMQTHMVSDYNNTLISDFDSVNHEVMWRILKARGVHPKLLALIKDLYSGSRARVTVHGTESDWFDIRTGVRQGCPLSPLLFNMYMDFLARQVIQECEEAGFKVAYRINGELVSPTEGLLNALMLLDAEDLVLLAPDSQSLEAALLVLDQGRWPGSGACLSTMTRRPPKGISQRLP